MTQEQRLVAGLTLCITVIMSLVAGLIFSLNGGFLTVLTGLIIIVYPLGFIAWKIYLFWTTTLRQLATYTQTLQNEQHTLRLKPTHPDSLISHLRADIERLANTKQASRLRQTQLVDILNQMLNSWPIPVCLFDHNHTLIYCNTAIQEAVLQPMLIGASTKSLGFTYREGRFTHPNFDHKWHCQTIEYVNQSNESAEASAKHKDVLLFSAVNVAQTINQMQSATQQNLIRVLAHELRNSLTPMHSMTDTLLAAEQLDTQQVKLVLERINTRSKRLLSFISEYSHLAHIPKPKLEWFNVIEVLDEAKLTLENTLLDVDHQGLELCFGDKQQITHVLINILKNAKEARMQEDGQSEFAVRVCVYVNGTEQTVEITDDGPGFSNIDNVLVPFYTTKTDGSGIGLSFCNEVIRNHKGTLQVSNPPSGGAKVTMVWPIIK